VENIPSFIAGVKAKKEKLFGFGHRVYRNFDPRAAIIKEVAEEVFTITGRDPLIEIAKALQDAALADDYFVQVRVQATLP
jgi:citrate synthase